MRRTSPLQRIVLPLFVGTLVAGSAATGTEIEGRLRLLMKKGDRPSRTAKPREAVVYFVPAAKTESAAEEEEHLVITRGKEFLPRITVVPRGTTVRFPNEDPILHNVFSVSGDNSFDLGLYNRGRGKSKRFDHPGVVRVFCNVHKAMAAYLLVVDTLHVVRPDSDGRYSLRHLPPGPGTLRAWHERTESVSMDVVVTRRGIEREIVLRVTKPRLPSHLNKYGRPYKRTSSEY